MMAEDNPVQTKLKFKITTKGIRDDSGEKMCQKVVKVVIKNGQSKQVKGAGDKRSEADTLVKPSMLTSLKKRGAETTLVSEKGKIRRMDRIVKVQCGSILRELMSHSRGWIFNAPVDPVKWKIPDYFTIITKPMDLGTIKRKLEENVYLSSDEFAADVRLTFSNAMLYNPPDHEVHKLARSFDAIFEKKWKSLEAKLKREIASFGNNKDQEPQQTLEKTCQDTKEINRFAARITHVPQMPMSSGGRQKLSFEEKLKLRVKLADVLSGNMTEHLRTVLQKFGLTGVKKEKLQSYIDATDDETLWNLRKEIKIYFDGRAGTVNPGKIAKDGSHSLPISVHKAKCPCGGLSCHCRDKSAPAQASSSDISSEGSSDHNSGDSKLDSEVKYPLRVGTSRPDPDSDGPGVVLNEENSPPLSTPTATADSGEGWSSFDVPLSPKKALRAAMLKSRFASTIYRVTHKGGNSDPVRMQKERERLEREQLEEKARIEREIKAAEDAIRRRAEAELKMQRERDREAARLALQKMERTVEIYENLEILKDIELLCCSPVGVENPLKRLGLHIKDDYLEVDEDEVLNGEEGEIL